VSEDTPVVLLIVLDFLNVTNANFSSNSGVIIMFVSLSSIPTFFKLYSAGTE